MTRNVLTLFLSFAVFYMCMGQSGFWKTYRYEDTRRTEFFSIVNDNDTLIVHGLTLNAANDQGMLFMKIDTFGDVITQKLYPDSLVPTPYFAEDGYDIELALDGGYMATGLANYVASFVKMNHDGELDFIYDYPTNSDILVSHYHKICTIDDGYFIGGEKYLRADSKTNVFVSRLNTFGDTIWERSYGNIGIYEWMGEMTAIDGNSVIIGGWKGEGIWGQRWFFCIDGLGNVKWEWLGEYHIKAGVVDDFVVTNDGGIVFLNTYNDTVVFVGNNVGLKRGRLVKLDSNRNEVWSTSVGHATFESNDLTDLVQTAEGDFIATGKYAPNEDGASGSALVNWTVKFSSEGEVLWERFDSTIWTPDRGVWNDPSGITLLSSGSIVICGTASRLSGADIGERGYIIKLDKNGCIDKGCELGPITRVEVPFDEYLEVLIYPNPASMSTTIEFPGRGDLILFDVQGKLMLSIQDAVEQASIDMSALLPGTYFLRIVTDDGWTVRTLIKE